MAETTAAAKLGGVISKQVTGALSNFTTGIKGAFISANPAVFAPMVGALSKGFGSLRADNAKEAKVKKEEAQSNSGFAEEVAAEKRKYEQLTLAIQKGMAINIEAIQRDVRQILELMKKESFWDKIKGLLAGLAGLLSLLPKKLIEFLKKLWSGLKNLPDIIKGFFAKLGEWLKRLKLPSFDDFIKRIKNWFERFKLPNFNDFITRIKNWFERFKLPSFSEFITRIKNWFERFKLPNIAGFLESIGEWIRRFRLPAFGAMIIALKEWFSKFKLPSFDDFILRIRKFFDVKFPRISDFFDKLREYFDRIRFPETKKIFADWLSELRKALKLDDLRDILKLDNLKNIIKFDAIRDFFKFEGLRNLINFDALRDALKFDNLKDLFKFDTTETGSRLGKLKDGIGKLITSLSDGLDLLRLNLFVTFENLKTSFSDGVKNIGKLITESDIVKSIGTMFDDMKTKFGDVGRGIDNLRVGITDSLRDAVRLFTESDLGKSFALVAEDIGKIAKTLGAPFVALGEAIGKDLNQIRQSFQSSVKTADTVRDVAKVGETTADAGRVADATRDIIKAGDAARDVAKVGDAVEAVKDTAKIADAMDAIKDTAKIQDSVRSIGLIGAFLGKFGDIAKGLSAGITGPMKILGNLTDVTPLMSGILKVLGPIGVIFSIFDGIANAKNTEKLQQYFGKEDIGMQERISAFIGGFIGSFGGAVDMIAKAMGFENTTIQEDITKGVTTKVNDMFNGLKAVMLFIGDVIRSKPAQELFAAISGTVEKAMQLFKVLYEIFASEPMKKVYETIGKIASKISETLFKSIGNMFDLLVGIFTLDFSKVKSAGGDLMDTIWKGVKGLAQILIDALAPAFVSTVNWLIEQLADVVPLFGDKIRKLKIGDEGKIATAKIKLSEVEAKIQSREQELTGYYMPGSTPEEQGRWVEGIKGPAAEKLRKELNALYKERDAAKEELRAAETKVKDASAATPGATPTTQVTPSVQVPPAATTFPSTSARVGGVSPIKEPEFYGKVVEVSQRLGIEPKDLLAVMAFESGISPSRVNERSGATGLIQFMPDTAKTLGTTTEELIKMTATEQLQYVEKYYKNAKLKPGSTLGDLYLSTFLPGATGMNDMRILGQKGGTNVLGKTASGKDLTTGMVYEQNKEAFDPKGTGTFTKADVVRIINQRGYKELERIIPGYGGTRGTGPGMPPQDNVPTYVKSEEEYSKTESEILRRRSKESEQRTEESQQLQSTIETAYANQDSRMKDVVQKTEQTSTNTSVANSSLEKVVESSIGIKNSANEINSTLVATSSDQTQTQVLTAQSLENAIKGSSEELMMYMQNMPDMLGGLPYVPLEAEGSIQDPYDTPTNVSSVLTDMKNGVDSTRAIFENFGVNPIITRLDELEERIIRERKEQKEQKEKENRDLINYMIQYEADTVASYKKADELVQRQLKEDERRHQENKKIEEEKARQLKVYEDEKARRLKGYEDERRRLQQQFDSQMQGIFRPMVDALKGPNNTPEAMVNAGKNLSNFLREDFTKLGVTIFGKQYGAAIGGTFQQLAGVYMNQFINESLAPALGMNADMLNRSINTYIKGVELIDPKLKQVNESLAKSRGELDKFVKEKGDITQADIVRAAGRKGGFTPEQKEKLAQLTAMRENIAKQEAQAAALRAQKKEYKNAALEDLVYGMTGISLGPRTMLDQYAGGAEGLTKDLAAFFGAPFKPAFGLSDQDAIAYKKLEAESKLYQGHVQGQATVMTNGVNGMGQVLSSGASQMHDSIRAAMSDGAGYVRDAVASTPLGSANGSWDVPGAFTNAVKEGVSSAFDETTPFGLANMEPRGGGGTAIPGYTGPSYIARGANVDEYGIPIQGPTNFFGQRAGQMTPAVGASGRLMNFGENMLYNMVGSRIGKSLGGGMTGNIFGKMAQGALRGAITGKGTIAQNIGSQFGLQLGPQVGIGDAIGGIFNSMNPVTSIAKGGMNLMQQLMPGGATGTLGQMGFDFFSGMGSSSLFGSNLASSLGMTQGAGFAGMSGSQIAGQAMGALGTAFAVHGISKALSGGYELKGVNEIAALASFIPGVGMIAAPIGALVNRAFGRKPKQVTGQGIQGTFTTEGVQGLQNYTDWFQKGGWFRSNKSGRDITAANAETVKAFTEVLQGTTKSVKDLGKIIGLDPAKVAGFQKAINIDLKGLNEEQQRAAIEKAFQQYGSDLVGYSFKYIPKVQRQGEDAMQTLEALAKSTQAFSSAFTTIDTKNLLGFDTAEGMKKFALSQNLVGNESIVESVDAIYNRLTAEGKGFGGLFGWFGRRRRLMNQAQAEHEDQMQQAANAIVDSFTGALTDDAQKLDEFIKTYNANFQRDLIEAYGGEETFKKVEEGLFDALYTPEQKLEIIREKSMDTMLDSAKEIEKAGGAISPDKVAELSKMSFEETQKYIQNQLDEADRRLKVDPNNKALQKQYADIRIAAYNFLTSSKSYSDVVKQQEENEKQKNNTTTTANTAMVSFDPSKYIPLVDALGNVISSSTAPDKGFIRPDANTVVTAEMTTWSNTRTGERFYASTSGWRPPSADWVVGDIPVVPSTPVTPGLPDAYIIPGGNDLIDIPQQNQYGFTPPPAGSITTSALVNWKNQVTGETYIAPSGGWTPPSSDWIQDVGPVINGLSSNIVASSNIVGNGLTDAATTVSQTVSSSTLTESVSLTNLSNSNNAVASGTMNAANTVAAALTSTANTVTASLNQLNSTLTGMTGGVSGTDAVASTSTGTMSVSQAASAISIGSTLSGYASNTFGLAPGAALAGLVGSALTSAGNSALAAYGLEMSPSGSITSTASSHAADMSGGSADLAGSGTTGGGSVDAAGNMGIGGSEAGGLGDAGGLSGGNDAGMWASGGRFDRNRPMIVGEVGPEILIPNIAGTIVPTHRIIEAVQSASSLDSQTRNLLETATPMANPVNKIYFELENENRRLNEEQKAIAINSAVVDNSVTTVSSPKTNIVTRSEDVRSSHPVAGVFTRAMTGARM